MTTVRPKLLGHPLHPMVVGFPVAFWLGAFLWDLVALVEPDPLWPRLAYWTLALGLLSAVPAVGSGFWELAALGEADGEAGGGGDSVAGEPIAWRHMAVMSIAFCCFLASFLLRGGAAKPPWTAVAAAAVGAVLTLAGGWLGGEMVFRHGMAVERREPR
jgi:uncharacterized membrane protein